MASGENGIELQEKLARLSRVNTRGIKDEVTLVTATGTMPPAWTIKILSLDSYNVYNVQLVNITEPGQNPSPVTDNIKAYNIAESFTTDGSVAAGTYAIMWRVGNKNVFYVEP